MSMKKKAVIPVILAGSLTMAGCIKAYDKPEFVEIEPNQTAFVIPLEGKTSEQGKFESESFLADSQVATKRIEVPHKWVKTGRFSHQGKYVDTVRVIVLDRYPQTREWSSAGNAKGFIGESKDSIKFEVGISATAQIEEKDSATFLYKYSGKTLEQVMDFEIRNKIGTVLLEKYGTMSMAEIRASKEEVITHVRKEVEPYFAKVGITLNNIGYVGDLKYVDAKVQEAINGAFNAQQKKEEEAIKNQQALEKAENEVKVAKEEARAIKERSSTIEQTIRLKELENEKALIDALPSITLPKVMGGGGNILDLPESLLQDAVAKEETPATTKK